MMSSIAIHKPAYDPQTDISALLARFGEMAAACRDERPELAAALDSVLQGKNGDDTGMDLIRAVFAASPYLSESLLGDAQFTARVLAEDATALYAEIRENLVKDAAAPDMSQAALMRLLRRAKRRVALLVALADLAGSWALEDVTATLSDFAECAVRIAVRHLLRAAHDAGHLGLPDADDPEAGSGLIVLGMGKLGARELNYSSDIDLIILFDENRAPVADPYAMQQIYVRLARGLVKMLDERTADGYVFRTDLRLRPDPGATPLAVSYGAAEIYYGSVGQNWERAAMIKARQLAGDTQSGADFLAMIRAWIFRKSLDFAAIQDIHAIKHRINVHKLSRADKGRDDGSAGRNIKLAHGGIREIEFFVQTQQLIFAGRNPRLRTPRTLDALDALVAAGHVPGDTASALHDAYVFLRAVEHRLQMVADQQTHSLPEDAGAMARFVRFMGYDDADAFHAVLDGHMRTVSRHYEALFTATPDAIETMPELNFSGEEQDPATLARLAEMGFGAPEHIAARIRIWHTGRARAMRSERARKLLGELTPALLDALADTPVPDDSFARFDAFLEALPAGVQIFSLFYQNPSLMRLVADIMGIAPEMAERLKTRPRLLDGVLSQDFFGALPDADKLRGELGLLLETARGYEDVLDIARRWVGDKRFHAGIHVLKGLTSAEDCGPFLSDVAEIAVTSLIPHVEADFARRHGRFENGGLALVAMGRFGSRQMSVDSDLDLVMVYEPASGAEHSDGERPLGPSQYYIRLTQRLLSAINAPTAEGKLYEVDMRLRPSGNAGPIAVSLESFESYERKDAWVWEHMALTRARIICGPEHLCVRLGNVIDDVLRMRRDADKLKADVADMRLRIEKEFGTTNPWDMKYRRGGIVDADFIAQYLMLRHGHDAPQVLQRNMTDALAALAEHGCLDRTIAADVMELLGLARRVQNFLRLSHGEGFDPQDAPPAFLQALALAALRPAPGEEGDCHFDALAMRLEALCARVFAHYQALLG